MVNNILVVLLFSVALMSAQAVSAQVQKFEGKAWSEFEGGAKAVCSDNDIDNDDDGLIELCYLEGLDAVRHVLDGKSYQAPGLNTTTTEGCASGGCKGYELVRDLDFTDDDSYRNAAANKTRWTTGAGWQPIGDNIRISDASIIIEDFDAIFEGNGHTLSNLRIIKIDTEEAYLFRELSKTAHVNGIGIVNAEVHGKDPASSLVGLNRGTVTNSYSTGQVHSSSRVGGLVGQNAGTIANSYNTASVSSTSEAGGLVGQNIGTISNSYNAGPVSGDSDVGGLVGWEDGIAIINSYNSGSVSSTSSAGGLVGWDGGLGSKIENSYSNVQTYALVGTINSQTPISIINSTTVTDAELTSPTGPTSIFSTWSSVAWYFGTSDEYPILRYSTGTNANYLACGMSQQPTCGNTLGGQGIKLFAISAATDVRITEIAEGETVALDATRAGGTNYRWQYTGSASLTLPTTNTPILRLSLPFNVVVGTTTGILPLRLTVNDGTMDTQQTVQIIVNNVNDPPTVKSTDNEVIVAIGATLNKQILVGVFEDLDEDSLRYTASGLPADSNLILSADGILRTRGTSRVMGSATTNTASAVIVSVSASDGLSTATTTFRLFFSAAPVITAIEPIATTEGEVVKIAATVSDANLDNLNYLWRATNGDKTASILAASLLSSATLVFTVPNDWASTTQVALSLSLSVGNGAATSTKPVIINIARTNNGGLTTTPTIIETDGKLTIALSILVLLASDPDGAGMTEDYQWQLCLANADCRQEAEWQDISGATSDAYQIPKEEAVANNRFRVQLTYHDGQGYRQTAISEVLRYQQKAMFMRLKLFLEGALQ